MDFGGPDPRKSSSRLSETLILLKSPFLAQGRFLIENGPKNGAKMELTSDQKSIKTMMHLLIKKNIFFFYEKRSPKEPKGTLQSRHFGVFSRLLARTPPKTQNRPKIIPKWNSNGAQMD